MSWTLSSGTNPVCPEGGNCCQCQKGPPSAGPFLCVRWVVIKTGGFILTGVQGYPETFSVGGWAVSSSWVYMWARNGASQDTRTTSYCLFISGICRRATEDVPARRPQDVVAGGANRPPRIRDSALHSEIRAHGCTATFNGRCRGSAGTTKIAIPDFHSKCRMPFLGSAPHGGHYATISPCSTGSKVSAPSARSTSMMSPGPNLPARISWASGFSS